MNWPSVQITEVARVVGGATPKSTVAEYWDGEINWVTPMDLADLDGKEISSTPRKITESGLKSCAAEQLPPGSVLFSSRAPIGHIAINRVPMATNQGFKSFVPGPDLDASFLYWWLDANRRRLQSMGNGATFKEVSKAVVERISLPVPPLPEQQRIAAILDQADALRRLRRQSLSLLSDLGQARFAQAFGEVPGTVPLEEAVSDTLIGLVRGAEDFGVSFEHPYVRMDAIGKNGQFVPSLVQRTDANLKELARYQLQDGDLLFNTRNSRELVGKTTIFRGIRGAIFNNNIMRIRFEQEWDPVFVEAYFRSASGRRELEQRKSGTTSVWAVYWSKLKTFLLPLVPYEKQLEFRELIEKIWSQEEKFRVELQACERLFSSLQHRAFRGEL